MACTGVLKCCLQGMLGTKQRSTSYFFLDTITLLLVEFQDPASLEGLKDQMNTALARLERDFPSFSAGNYVWYIHKPVTYINLFKDITTHCIMLLMGLNDLVQCTQHGCIPLSVSIAGFVKGL